MNDERYIPLEVVAECFDVQVHWLEEVCEHDLVPSVRREPVLSIEVHSLEQVARIVRLHFHQGVELSVLSVLLPR